MKDKEIEKNKSKSLITLTVTDQAHIQCILSVRKIIMHKCSILLL